MSIGKNVFKDLRFIITCLFYPRKTKAIYIGYTGYGNLGDEALKESIFQLLKPSLILSESQGFIIRAFEKIGLLRFKLMILGGGTFILNTLSPESHLDRIAKTKIKKKIAFGTGVVNPALPEHPIAKEHLQKWIKTLEELNFLSVRGPLSAQILKDQNVKNPVHIIGDPVCYFIRNIKQNKNKTKKLGINIGPTLSGNTKGLLWGMDEEGFLNEVMDFIKIMLNEGWEIGFVPVSKEDEYIMQGLLKKNQLSHRIPIFRSYSSTERTIDHLETFDVFIGEKLHSVILSYCANTPAIMLEYRPKCRDFMASIGMEEFNVRTNEFTPIEMKKKLEHLYHHIDEIRLTTNERCKTYKNKLIQASYQVMDL